jgi:hypothetical protein
MIETGLIEIETFFETINIYLLSPGLVFSVLHVIIVVVIKRVVLCCETVLVLLKELFVQLKIFK